MKKILLSLFCCAIFIASVEAQNQYKTIAAGNWNTSGTWSSVAPYDGIPPATIPQNHVVEINHRVIYNVGSDLKIEGRMSIVGDTLRFPTGSGDGVGKSIEVSSTGYLEVIDGGLIIPRGSSGNIKNFGRTVSIRSYVEVAQNWESTNGSRKFINSCLKAGENYSNVSSTDTLAGVCIELGTASTSGSFSNDGGIIRLNQTTILLRGTSGNFENKSPSSQILTYLNPTYAINGLYVQNGNLINVGNWVAPVNRYCISGNIADGQSQPRAVDLPPSENCPSFANDNQCLDCRPDNIPLPVNFKTFTATRSNSASVSVTWTTATEQNSKGFNVQKNINGAWETIAFVSSRAPGGNSSTDLSYSFIDINKEKGITQYRIQQVDLDGKAKYSDIRAIRGESTLNKIVIYPNPSVDGKLNVVFEDNTSIRDIIVNDMSGKVIRSYKNISNNILVIERLTSGFYTIKITNRTTAASSVEKVVVK